MSSPCQRMELKFHLSEVKLTRLHTHHCCRFPSEPLSYVSQLAKTLHPHLGDFSPGYPMEAGPACTGRILEGDWGSGESFLFVGTM